MTDRLTLVANISLLYGELPLLERPAAAAAAGFQAIECWWPFGAIPTPDRAAIDDFVSAVEGSGLPLTGMNLFAGDMPAGERGLASRPDRQQDFDAALAVSIEVAERTGLTGMNALYGHRIEGGNARAQDELAIRNLVSAVLALAPLGVTLFVEPLARGLNGAYPIETAAEAVAVVERVRIESGRDSIALLFDTFHLASNDEDLAAVIRDHHDLIGHVQLADAPGRGEPGSGTIDFPGLLDDLWDVGYRSLVAAEYKPTKPTTGETLAWVAATPHLALEPR